MSFISKTTLLMQLGQRSLLGRGSLPRFLILGAQKAGTTSLFNYICSSPQVVPPLRKEVHYFDRDQTPSLSLYRSFFPDERELSKTGAISGEATPFYLFHPDVPQRIAQSGLRAKMIVILRCPVERAWSHYRHEARKGREELSFSEALLAEDKRLRGTTDRVLDRAHLEALQRKSYLARGKYMAQISRFQDVFGPEQIFTLSLDHLHSDPKDAVTRCCAFLEIEPPPGDASYRVYNAGHDSMKMPQVDPQIFQEAFDSDLKQLHSILPEAEIWRERLNS